MVLTAAANAIKLFGLTDACHNGCHLFYGDKYVSLLECKFCGHDRYDEDGKPYRTATYIPISNILATMFESPEFAQEVKAHESAYQEMKAQCADDEIDSDDWVMDDIWYSPGSSLGCLCM